MNPKPSFLAISMVIVLALLLTQVEVTMAVTCNPLQLSPCASAITSSNSPSFACCTRIREQKPCLCGYMRNPNLQRYIKSPGARRVANYCHTPMPRC